jgi:hypothetical protein
MVNMSKQVYFCLKNYLVYKTFHQLNYLQNRQLETIGNLVVMHLHCIDVIVHGIASF